MAKALRRLLAAVPVCVISGGDLPQFESQLLASLEADDDLLTGLHLMPTCGTRYLRHENGGWKMVYSHELSEPQKRAAEFALEEEAKRLGLWEERPWGPIIEDRKSQVTFSALGQAAPLEAKRAWDPDGTKKAALAEAVTARLPDLEVRSGGSTSVDITARGVDKSYGMARLVEQTGIRKENMLFVGDRLDEGGNDYPVLAAGWDARAVCGWQDTLEVIEQVLAQVAPSAASPDG